MSSDWGAGKGEWSCENDMIIQNESKAWGAEYIIRNIAVV